MLSLVYSSSRIRQYRSVSKVRSFGSLVISIHWLYPYHTIPCSERRGERRGGGVGRFLRDHSVLRGNCEGISSF